MIVDVKLIRQEQRKIILKRAYTATDYFTHGQEVGFEHWRVLKSIEPKLYSEPIGLWFLEVMRPKETSPYVMGVEVSMSYDGIVPEGMEIIELPEQLYLQFQGPAFADGELVAATTQLKKDIEQYDTAVMGYRYVLDKAPIIEFDPLPARGCMFAYPVEKVHV